MHNQDEISRIKKEIKDNMLKAIEEYSDENGCGGMFGNPLIAYHYARDPIFDELCSRGLCEHPGKIYRPGNTIITYFLPYAPHIAQSNKGGSMPSEEWLRAYSESTRLIMRLNRAIREVLESLGRLVSCLNTPVDWDEEKASENWSHKTAAYLSGMGSFSTAGSFVTPAGFAGRFSGVITDGLFFGEKPKPVSACRANAVAEDIGSKPYENSFSEECIASCPCGAISKNKIDRFKCQNHCKKINSFVPSPDVCGKCFFFA